MRFLLICLCYLAFINGYSQTPGNVPTNLVLWLKPSSFNGASPIPTTATWKDLSSRGNNFKQIISWNRPEMGSILVNYNSVVDFSNRNDDYWDYMDGKTILPNGQTNFSIFTMVFPKANTGEFSSLIEFKRGQDSRFEIQRIAANELKFEAVKMSPVNSSSPIVSGLPNFRPIIGSTISSGTEIVTSLNGMNGVSQINSAIVANNSGSRISSFKSGRGPLNAYLGDIIVYDVAVTPLNRRKIESYLAVKYGISLQANYVNTAGTIIYDVSSYNNNIIGIGRDSSTTLLQKQSQNQTDSTRIYVSTLMSSNALNTGTFSKDVSHVIMGDNGGRISRTSSAVGEMPVGLISRIEREWKITKTNFDQSFSIDIKMSPASIPGSINVADLRLLIDDDGNFANGGTRVFQNGDDNGTEIRYVAGLLTISNINNAHVANNSTVYFTIASASISTPLPIELISFDAAVENQQVALKWQTGSERNNDFFTVERSADGIQWTDISTTKGAGSSSTLLSYEALDQNPLDGVSYYRLKQTDFDGVFTHSEAKSIHFLKENGSKVLIFPNPAENIVTVEADRNELKEVRVFNILGKEVTHLIEITRENATRIVLDVVNLPKGVYNVKTKSTSTKVTIN